ncbi:V-type proton ATPase subunit D [Nymphon striatum]|nr:V-type proton ATPase subunit D [Nymphon striatum]
MEELFSNNKQTFAAMSSTFFITRIHERFCVTEKFSALLRFCNLPESMALMVMKGRLKAAQKGHSLLKKKADALQMRFRMILRKIIDTKILMGEVMKEASFSLAEAKFTTGDLNHIVLQNVTKAQIKVRSKKEM